MIDGNYSLLYVEDDTIMQEAMLKLLKKMFNEIYIASNGKEGLEAFKKYKPDLIISDIKMPIMDGLEMVREIRRVSSDVKVIALTAYSDVDYLFKSIEIGIDKYILKPMDVKKFQSIVKSTIDDLRKSKELEAHKEEIKKWKEKYELAIDGVNDGFWEFDTINSELFASNKFFEMIGYKKDELNFRQIFALIHPDDLEKVKDELNKFFKKLHTNYRIEFRIKHKSGKFIWILSRAKGIFDSNNEPIKLIGFHTDITTEKEYEFKLEKKSKELIELNENLDKRVKQEVLKNIEKDRIMHQELKFAFMGEMFAMIAHQWRQPLAMISSASSDLKIKKELNILDDEALISNLNAIINKTQHLSEIINDFINFFKLDKIKEEFNVLVTLREVLSIIEGDLKNKNIEIKLSVDDELSVFGYKNELKQVIFNLILNSKEAFDEYQNDKIINIHAKNFSDKIKIYIKDNAGGVDEELIEKIFNPYVTTKDETKSMGMGLFIAKTIIHKSFSGDLKLKNYYENSERVGVIFTITLFKGKVSG